MNSIKRGLFNTDGYLANNSLCWGSEISLSIDKAPSRLIRCSNSNIKHSKPKLDSLPPCEGKNIRRKARPIDFKLRHLFDAIKVPKPAPKMIKYSSGTQSCSIWPPSHKKPPIVQPKAIIHHCHLEKHAAIWWSIAKEFKRAKIFHHGCELRRRSGQFGQVSTTLQRV